MTLIDFYVLQSQDINERHRFACRYIEKAVRQGNRVLVATEDQSMSQAFDELLWCFRPESFIPHRVLGNETSAENLEPVVISHDQDDIEHHDVLVNLTQGRPAFFSRFKRMAEIVVQNEPILSSTRENFKYYRSRGYPLKTHTMK